MNNSLSNILYEKYIEYSELGALKIDDKIVSYKELNSKALKLASFLLSCGASNESIGIIGQRKISHYVGVLGAIYANCHYVPINTKYTTNKIKEIINDAKINYLISDNSDLLDIYPSLSDLDLKKIIVPEGKCNNDNWIGEDAIL